jgi:uncharacterized protein (DUF433 family)
MRLVLEIRCNPNTDESRAWNAPVALESRNDVCENKAVNDRISINPKVCHGQACIRGTRIPVHQIVRMFAHGDPVETLLRAYPSITREDVMACLDYAATRE